MTETNHRRKSRPPVDRRHPVEAYDNGYVRTPRVDGARSGFLDKSLHSWGRLSPFSDVAVLASIPNDFTNGHRGMAKSVRGAKKFVRTRFRFHENAEVRAIMRSADEVEPSDGG